MGSLSRTKGHSFERFIARVFRAIGHPNARRQLEYQIDQCRGIDLAETGIFNVQCKKTKKYVSMNTIQEIEFNEGEIPVLIAQGDNQPPLVVMPLEAFMVFSSILNHQFEGEPRDLLKKYAEVLKNLKKGDTNGTNKTAL